MTAPDARTFYTERIPAQFNRTLDAAKSSGDERVYEAMCSVDTSLCAVVRGEGGGTFHMNVDRGRMTIGDAPAHPAFLTLVHDIDALGALARESGDSVLGFLGALAGLQEEIRLTPQRLQSLAGVSGALRFVLEGDDGFSLLACFGEGPVPEEPACTLSVTPEAYQQLRGGELNPQEAFLGGQVTLEGDMQMAMQVALAAVSPD